MRPRRRAAAEQRLSVQTKQPHPKATPSGASTAGRGISVWLQSLEGRGTPVGASGSWDFTQKPRPICHREDPRASKTCSDSTLPALRTRARSPITAPFTARFLDRLATAGTDLLCRKSFLSNHSRSLPGPRSPKHPDNDRRDRRGPRAADTTSLLPPGVPSNFDFQVSLFQKHVL